MLRVFTKIGSHHSEEDFAVQGKEPKDEAQIYAWKDANLPNLTDLFKEVAPEARRRNAKLSFAFVYPDKRGRFVLRQVNAYFSFWAIFVHAYLQLEPYTSASMWPWFSYIVIDFDWFKFIDLLSPITCITTIKKQNQSTIFTKFTVKRTKLTY